MKDFDKNTQTSRRGFLGCAAGVALAGPSGAAFAQDAQGAVEKEPVAAPAESFYGDSQSGIASPPQAHTYFAVFDLTTKSAKDVVELMRVWTDAAVRLMSGETARPIDPDLSVAAADSGDALDLGSARLSLTFGFGPELFIKGGEDRYGWASLRPAPLAELPKFNGDQLTPNSTGGDLSVQACADDPQVAFHAIRQLVSLAYGVAQLRWTQTGFAAAHSKGTARNLMGFKDGTQRPADLGAFVWVGNEGPDWMRRGSYLVVRKIRLALEHWDRTPVDFQEQVVGRAKYSGAPLSGKSEFDALDLDAAGKDGEPVIAEDAHVRLAAAAQNDGAQILRRAFSYNDGTNLTAERWPPWRQGLEYDAGLLFLCYQRDPRTGFIKIFDRMAKMDALNQFTTHVGSGLFACPGGVTKGEFIGQRLFKQV